MPSITKLVTASALAGAVLAAPAPRYPVKRGFTINQKIAKPYQAPAVQLRKVYQKYNVAVPEDVAKAAQGDGSVAATPEDGDVEYLSPVEIGGQTVNLDFDTGSADLWVFSSELPSSQQSGHELYDPSKSNSSKELNGATWEIQYGDGSGASGNVYTDDVNVGGVVVKGQAVELASKISQQFQQDENNDGLLGLAFSSINTVQPTQQKTFFDNAIDQGVLNSNLFTVDLKKGAPGTYDFGFIDDSKHTGDIHYTKIDSSKGFWEFTGTGYGIGDDNFQQQSIDAIADTGTTLILIEDEIVDAYYKGVDGAQYDSQQGGYTFSCDANLPDFTLGIGDYQAKIPGSFINLAPVDDSGSTCFGGIQSSQGIGQSIYGDVFLKAFFAVFDSDNSQFGVAEKSL